MLAKDDALHSRAKDKGKSSWTQQSVKCSETDDESLVIQQRTFAWCNFACLNRN
jgi:hypothetical protein